jgi:hypothetical protein
MLLHTVHEAHKLMNQVLIYLIITAGNHNITRLFNSPVTKIPTVPALLLKVRSLLKGTMSRDIVVFLSAELF